MASRRKAQVLSVDQKYKILQIMTSDKTQKTVAKDYSIEEATVRNIKSQREEIITYFETSAAIDSNFSKYLRTLQRKDLDNVIYQWFMRCKNKGVILTGALIRKKALEFNEKLYGEPNFKASWNWFKKFKHRYNICETNIYNFRTTEQAAADNFTANFTDFLRIHEFTLENIYNVDYAGLIWRAVPEETLMFHREGSTLCPEMYKDYVTILLCANATGCHKLPALVISKFANSQNLKNMNINSLSIMYEENNKALMDGNLFNKWFQKCFLKSVIEKQMKQGYREKILLLVDDVRWNLFINYREAEHKDEFVIVMSFPCYVTPLVQPMDCGIIECFKRMYRKELLQTIKPLPTCCTQEDAVSNHKLLTMWDCCRMVQDAWMKVENTILKKAWGKLLKKEGEQNFRERIIETDIGETVELLHKLPGCQRCNTIDVKNWYEIDNEEKMLMKIYTDEVLGDFENNALN
ncbi:jerky protein homolog-like [Bombus pascuorum]|uniref:jerky protein homolog-like n=1 Tax=Bombus pascuorum TaxID=65598 RepID=UPI00298DCCA1|nr:jerky protein homolog-like [Bombus pascuorum]XP_060819674.1 jerky protein homolog-like [Bombus pascuorum]